MTRDLASRVLKGDHRALGKAISIVEAGGEPCRIFIRELYPHTGRAFTVGIYGSTGTGKSTRGGKSDREFGERGRRVGVCVIQPCNEF